MLNNVSNAAGRVALLDVLAPLNFNDRQAVIAAHQRLAATLARDPLCVRAFVGVNRPTIWLTLAALELRRCADEQGQPTGHIPGDRDADLLKLAEHLSNTGADELLQHFEDRLASHVLSDHLAQADWRCVAAHVYHQRGEAHMLAGDYAQAVQAFKSGVTACLQAGRVALVDTFYEAVANALESLADRWQQTGKHLQAGIARKECADFLSRAGANGDAADALAKAAANFVQADAEARAATVFDEAAQRYYRMWCRDTAAACWEHAGEAYAHEGMHRKAIEAFTECVTVCEALGVRLDVFAAQTWQKLANVHRRERSFEAAKRADESAAKCYERFAKRELDDGDPMKAANASTEAAAAWRSAKEHAREADAWDATAAAYRKTGQLKKAFEAGRRAIEAAGLVEKDVGPERERSAATWEQIAERHRLDGEDAQAAEAYGHAAAAHSQEIRPKQARHARRRAAEAWERLAKKAHAQAPRNHTAVAHAWEMTAEQYKYAGEHMQAARALEMRAQALRENGQEVGVAEPLKSELLKKADAVDRRAATTYWEAAKEFAEIYDDTAASGAARAKAAAIWERLGEHELAAGGYLEAAKALREVLEFTEANAADVSAAHAYIKTAEAARAVHQRALRIGARQRAGDIWWRLGESAQAARVYEQLFTDCYESDRRKQAQAAALSAARAWVRVAEYHLHVQGDHVKAAAAWKAAARAFRNAGLRVEAEHALTQAGKALADARQPPVGT